MGVWVDVRKVKLNRIRIRIRTVLYAVYLETEQICLSAGGRAALRCGGRVFRAARSCYDSHPASPLTFLAWRT